MVLTHHIPSLDASINVPSRKSLTTNIAGTASRYRSITASARITLSLPRMVPCLSDGLQGLSDMMTSEIPMGSEKRKPIA